MNAKALKNRRSFKFNPYIIPIMFIVGILPLIVHLKIYETNLENYDFFAEKEYPDFYLYYKSLFFIITSAVMLVLTIAQFFVRHFELKAAKLFIPLAGYAVLSFLSALCSKTPNFSFTGIFEQFESVWVLLGYAMTVYYCFIFVSSMKDIDQLFIVFAAGTIIMLLIGLSQAFSQDFFRTNFARYLLLPAEYWNDEAAVLEFDFPLGRVYLTLYNPNYVGSYVSLISPVFLLYAFAKKKIWMAIVNIVIYVGLLLCILGSGSRAGFIGVAFSLLLLAVVFNKKLVKFLPEVIIVIVLIVGIVYTYNNYTNGQLVSRAKQAMDFEETEFNLKSIETNDENIVIHYKDHEMRFSHVIDENANFFALFFKDENDDFIQFNAEYNEEGGMNYTFEDDRFKSFSLKFFMNNIPYFYFTIDGKTWKFCYYNDSYYYGNNRNKRVKMHDSESVEFLEKYSRAFSGRGFIWSKTLPLLKDNIFLGTGPDTFLVNFPNDDYVAMSNGGYPDELMTKPHNMYLQIAVQTGVISLICFLVFYIWYFLSSIRLYMRSDKNNAAVIMGIGILCGTFGYMVVGIINDSMVCIAPLYWVLIGIGLALNHIIKKDRAEAEKLQEVKSKEKNNKPEAKQITDNKTADEKSIAADKEDSTETGSNAEKTETNENDNASAEVPNNTETETNSGKKGKSYKRNHKSKTKNINSNPKQ